MKEYKLSEQATQDIDSILDYTFTNFGVDQTENYHHSLKECFEFLADNPGAGRQRPELAEALRSHPHEHHTVFYQVFDDHILIVRVLHEKIDDSQHFGTEI